MAGQFGCLGAARACVRRSGKFCAENHVMKMTFTAAACAAFVCLGAIHQPAMAQQKTAKECNAGWAADKAAIQASGKTKRAFVAECRGVPVATAPKAATLEQGQFATEAEAKASCPEDAVVWVNLRSGVYHVSGSRSYGQTKVGAYMCEQASVTAGFHAPKNGKRSAT